MLGVVSWGNKCAVEYYPGVNVGVSNFVEWIEGTMENNSVPSTSTTPTKKVPTEVSSTSPTTLNQSCRTLPTSFYLTLMLHIMYQIINY